MEKRSAEHHNRLEYKQKTNRLQQDLVGGELSFPEDLDLDRVLSEALGGVETAVKEWLGGAPTSEEPLMNRLTAQFTRRRLQLCDVGSRVPVFMTAKVALLHRRVDGRSDAYGADLAITVDIPEREYRKTALFQLKVSDDFQLSLKRSQLSQATEDQRTKDRSFVLVADKSRRRMRIATVSEAISMISEGSQTAEINCADWPPLGEWLVKWLSCDVGPFSRPHDKKSIEALLQRFVVEAPAGWDSPWGDGDAADYSEDLCPAKAWLEMFFYRS